MREQEIFPPRHFRLVEKPEKHGDWLNAILLRYQVATIYAQFVYSEMPESDFLALEVFKFPRENGVIITIKQLRYTILTAVSLCSGRNAQFHIPNAFVSLFHG